jgi:hypothetical protein
MWLQHGVCLAQLLVSYLMRAMLLPCCWVLHNNYGRSVVRWPEYAFQVAAAGLQLSQISAGSRAACMPAAPHTMRRWNSNLPSNPRAAVCLVDWKARACAVICGASRTWRVHACAHQGLTQSTLPLVITVKFRVVRWHAVDVVGCRHAAADLLT